MESLNVTPTVPAPSAPVRKHFDLTRLLVQRDRLPWFWFFFTVAVLLLSAMDRYHIVSQFKQRERVVIIDPAGTYYLSPLLQFSEAKDLRVQEMVEFRAKQLHQKAEIGQIDILATRDNEVLAAVTGQIIRSGIFQDKAFTEAFPFTLRLRLIRNPNMALNGRFPTAVGDFKYEINR